MPRFFRNCLKNLPDADKKKLLHWIEEEGASNIAVEMFNLLDDGEWTALRQG